MPDSAVDVSGRRLLGRGGLLRLAEKAAPLVLAGALGLAWWSVALMIAPPHPMNSRDPLWLVFCTLTAATVVGFGLVWRGQLSLSLPMGLGVDSCTAVVLPVSC